MYQNLVLLAASRPTYSMKELQGIEARAGSMTSVQKTVLERIFSAFK